MTPQAEHTISLEPDAKLIARLTKILGVGKVIVNREQLTIPHTYQTTIALRNEGYDVPAPILTQYDFPGREPAFEVQKQTSALLTTNTRAYVLNELGTGKTRCVCYAYDFLRSSMLAEKMLVIAPLSALVRTWGNELMQEFPWLRYEVLHGSKEQRLKRLDNKHADVYIINHDGVYTILSELVARKDINTVCVDELGVYRDGGSRRTKVLKHLVMAKAWCWGLTGAPMPRAVTDIWGPCSAITPNTVPAYFSTFRAQLMLKKGPFTWVAKPHAEEMALSCMRPSVRFTLDEITELPEQILNYYEAELTPKQLEIYTAVQAKAIAMIEEKKIDAMNAGALLSKLLQVALGWVYTREGDVIALPNTPRMQLILDLIDSCEQKVILFASFKSAVAAMSKLLTVNTVSHAIITGDVPVRERDVIFGKFQDTEEYKVLLAHPATMSHSLTLTKATTTIWSGPVTSLDIFHQANRRTYRIGQKHKSLIAMLGGTKAEKRVYEILGRNEKMQNNFLKLVELLTLKENA